VVDSEGGPVAAAAGHAEVGLEGAAEDEESVEAEGTVLTEIRKLEAGLDKVDVVDSERESERAAQAADAAAASRANGTARVEGEVGTESEAQSEGESASVG
jgi:hypothetical protein